MGRNHPHPQHQPRWLPHQQRFRVRQQTIGVADPSKWTIDRESLEAHWPQIPPCWLHLHSDGEKESLHPYGCNVDMLGFCPYFVVRMFGCRIHTARPTTWNPCIDQTAAVVEDCAKIQSRFVHFRPVRLGHPSFHRYWIHPSCGNVSGHSNHRC